MSGDDEEALKAAAPTWATFLWQEGGTMVWSVRPPAAPGVEAPATVIQIWSEEGILQVSEHGSNRRLPVACPELHINVDSTFCLGRYGFFSDEPAHHAQFWQALGEFIVYADFAERRGFWPRGRWLSHGTKAMKSQLEAEQLASKLTLEEDYADWIEAGEGRLSSLFSMGVSARICPLCQNQACMHIKDLRRLLALEKARSAAHASYFDYARSKGVSCCRRMPSCKLQQIEAAA